VPKSYIPQPLKKTSLNGASAGYRRRRRRQGGVSRVSLTVVMPGCLWPWVDLGGLVGRGGRLLVVSVLGGWKAARLGAGVRGDGGRWKGEGGRGKGEGGTGNGEGGRNEV